MKKFTQLLLGFFKILVFHPSKSTGNFRSVYIIVYVKASTADPRHCVEEKEGKVKGKRMKKSMRSQSKENVIKGSPRYFVGALPYRLCIRKPLVVSQTDRPDKIMDDSDFKNSVANCNSFRAFMLGFLRNYEDFHTYDDASLGIRIPQVEIDDTYQNEIRCSIYTGKYGYESELRNIKKSTQVKTRTVDDCELMPFACRIVFPRGHENCVVIFEKFGNNSCVGVFVRALREYVNAVFKDNGYKVNYGYITNLKYVMKQFRDNVRSIRFIRYSKLTDEFDFIND